MSFHLVFGRILSIPRDNKQRAWFTGNVTSLRTHIRSNWSTHGAIYLCKCKNAKVKPNHRALPIPAADTGKATRTKKTLDKHTKKKLDKRANKALNKFAEIQPELTKDGFISRVGAAELSIIAILLFCLIALLSYMYFSTPSSAPAVPPGL